MHAAMTGLSEAQRRAMARRELERRRREGGVKYFRPNNARQEAALRCTQTGCLILGGNRSGKTYIGGAEATYRLLGEHPFKKVHKAPVKIWCCSQDLPGRVRAKGGNEQEIHKQLEMLKLMIPTEALRGGAWAKAYSPSEFTVSLRNGSIAVFKGYSQGPLQFESDAIHGAWPDEEPPDKSIFTSILMRLADYNGCWWMTATPVLSLLGRGWIEELWEKRADPACGYETHQLFTLENSTLDRGVVTALLANLPEEERKVRAEGAFARLGGRILSDFNEELHRCAGFLPGDEWQHYLIFDPGWTRGAGLWAAARDGNLVLYDEHYEEHWTPAQHMRALHVQWILNGRPRIEVLADPAGFNPGRSTGGTETPADVDEMRYTAQEIGADWFLGVRKANNSDGMAWRVKRYLSTRRMQVCSNLQWWRWEAERWTRQKERAGVRAVELPVPEAPIKRNNHLMACTRYLCNELPEPTPREPLPLSDLEKHWARLGNGRDEGRYVE